MIVPLNLQQVSFNDLDALYSSLSQKLLQSCGCRSQGVEGHLATWDHITQTMVREGGIAKLERHRKHCRTEIISR